MKYVKTDLPFAAKLRQCRDQNKLCNSNNYEKDYIIDYGYKFEEPTAIYQLSPLYTREDECHEKSEKLIQALIAKAKKVQKEKGTKDKAKTGIMLEIAKYKPPGSSPQKGVA